VCSRAARRSQIYCIFQYYHTKMNSERATRFLETAQDLYDEITFNDPDDLFNKPAPEPYVSLIIGLAFAFISAVWWILRTRTNVQDFQQTHPSQNMSMNLFIRIMISAAIDNDRNLFTMVVYAASSFIFLAGFQWHFEYTLLAMFIFYILASSLESIRIILALYSSENGEIIHSSDVMKRKFAIFEAEEKGLLHPSNVYEDVGRKPHIVLMIFITQVILIAFVCIDIKDKPTASCIDGTPDCPLVGTFGSYGFYLLGIFMALVFQLGPKTNFGESEQNPAYWLRLFLEIEKSQKTTISWENKLKAKTEKIDLYFIDIGIWLRFMMSFLINGIGFHVLVHALPLQVAAQSSLTSVVFRAVGMMYLVDLDDTPGYELTIKDDSGSLDDSKMGYKLTSPDGVDSNDVEAPKKSSKLSIQGSIKENNTVNSNYKLTSPDGSGSNDVGVSTSTDVGTTAFNDVGVSTSNDIFFSYDNDEGGSDTNELDETVAIKEAIARANAVLTDLEGLLKAKPKEQVEHQKVGTDENIAGAGAIGEN